MGIFRVNITIQNPSKPSKRISIEKVLVDTGAEYSWLPREFLIKVGLTVRKKDVPFILANENTVTRDIGYAIIRCDDFETIDEVVFGKEGDLALLGSRTLEGFGAIVDARKKKLVASGPLTAA
jgi:predicted aspartyl protease